MKWLETCCEGTHSASESFMNIKTWIAAGAAAVGMLQPASAALTFSGSSGALAASVSFEVVGSQLKVILTNTSASDVLVPADVLTAVFFNSTGTLTPVSALLTAGSLVYYDPDGQPAGGNVGGEWGYGTGSALGRASAISSTGATSPLSAPNFGGPDLSAPPALDGLQYGILSAGDDTGTGNSGVTGSGGLIKNSVTFLLDIGSGFSLASVGSVIFQYGTALTEPSYGGSCTSGCSSTPEPGTLALAGLALLAMTARRQRRG
ncbi:MAG: PEP-CTERM sorting domain-containing protein [Burkholderiales bacterium]|nr:PEP-CTERM sorting domain-containing protein [Burkholderiales bacterium]